MTKLEAIRTAKKHAISVRPLFIMGLGTEEARLAEAAWGEKYDRLMAAETRAECEEQDAWFAARQLTNWFEEHPA
jgi:hypothetical protein